ncbi:MULTISPECIES: winged helix-turn-helix domain-containing protein [Vibrio]|uniref:winged helix-turn-helix domain-containing protein n=1 Tax=Vibrio TaxID=662 RepID=UPI00142EBC6E|nr:MULTISPECIES: winged helix-turn-helix domain-containing protein [Vibrio]
MNNDNKYKIQITGLCVNTDNCLVRNAKTQEEVSLSLSECLIIQHLINHFPQTVERAYLLEHCWPGKVVTGSSLNVAVKNIRTALEQLTSECEILTIQKQGYCIRAKEVLPTVTHCLAPLRKRDSKTASQEANANELTSDVQKSSFIQINPDILWFSAGVSVSLLIISVFAHLAFFMDYTRYNGVDVYHDGVELNSAFKRQLDVTTSTGTQAIYLHRIGLDCSNVQTVILEQGQWQEVTSQFDSVSCVKG